ncbi:MAG: aspartate/glutamate racemase family protein [Pseudomonadota bacterium]
MTEGCNAIATTCGFLALIRPRLTEALGVPVAASALEQAAQIHALLPPGRTLGILTISARSLTPEHLRVAGVRPDAPIQGIEESDFAKAILGNARTFDIARARDDMVKAAKHFVEVHPHIGAIILECTNMVPYAADVAKAIRRPVFSIYTYVRWFHAALHPHVFLGGINQQR